MLHALLQSIATADIQMILRMLTHTLAEVIAGQTCASLVHIEHSNCQETHVLCDEASQHGSYLCYVSQAPKAGQYNIEWWNICKFGVDT